jgi:glycosyltransferase involved in cell wall biosynthesis
MARISGVMITLNEAHQVHFALGTLVPWCDEVVVVDQHSDDGTAEIARSLGARVLTHERTGGMADPARRFAVSQATGDWVFILDADEMVPPRLAAELRRLAESDAPVEVVMVPRANVILGRWLRYGSNWPSRHARFFRPGGASIGDRIHHSLEPARGARVERLPADPGLAIWHFPGGDLSYLVRKVDRYTTIEARQALERGVPPAGPAHLLRDAARYLWRQYIRDRGYRDGTMGLAVALTRTYYRVLTAAKIWEAPRLEARRAEVSAVRGRLLSRWGEGGGEAGEARVGDTAGEARVGDTAGEARVGDETGAARIAGAESASGGDGQGQPGSEGAGDEDLR